jgi:HSP20 family molecular chaperone IbpA
MKSLKKRYSLPAKLVESLWTDDAFLRDVEKIKKGASSFPKNDQWKDGSGFHLVFALAGYDKDDIRIYSRSNVITVESDGMESEPVDRPDIKEDDDAFTEYSKDARSRVNQGFIVRGIARRKFQVSYLISEEFDVGRAEASMDNGLLRITIPENEAALPCNIEIVMGRK